MTNSQISFINKQLFAIYNTPRGLVIVMKRDPYKHFLLPDFVTEPEQAVQLLYNNLTNHIEPNEYNLKFHNLPYIFYKNVIRRKHEKRK